MGDKFALHDLKIRIGALELLLIARKETTRENLEVFRKEAEQNYVTALDEFRRDQWAKIKPGSLVTYYLGPSTLNLEVISISPEPFGYIAGKVIAKEGKSGYRVGEIFSTTYPDKLLLHGLMEEMISKNTET